MGKETVTTATGHSDTLAKSPVERTLGALSPEPSAWPGEFLFELVQTYSGICKGPGARM